MLRDMQHHLASFSASLSPAALMILGATAAWAADPVPLNVKTGQWETTIESKANGSPIGMIPPEMLARLTPEQRAKMEEAMKKAAAPRTNTYKSCVTKDDLAHLNLDKNRNPSCKTTLVTSTPAKQEVRFDCDIAGGKQTGTGVVEAVSSESMKFSVVYQGSGNGASFNGNSGGTSKWIGPACTEK
jgi:Protein of unknown function (DUF3617)